ncbi:MAG: hypothetical protein E6Q97_16270 [Desulfurellales bacterium]|jgi:regulator of extracellular matrix RemA (YlzA/DUF370 family)|nr:MAG: hypothetical protein E6Q97_16270 [Desulfurellales bacterium]
MSAATVQFVEMVRLEHARIERLKQAADERGEIIENQFLGRRDRRTDLQSPACRRVRAGKISTLVSFTHAV